MADSLGWKNKGKIMTGFDLAVMCLALNVYHEAGNEPITGQYAVAFVTINRVKEINGDVCTEVFKDIQFSWTKHALDKRGVLFASYRPKKNNPAWTRAQLVAKTVLGSEVTDFTLGSKWYHADYIQKPIWAYNLTKVAQYGHHIFYR